MRVGVVVGEVFDLDFNLGEICARVLGPSGVRNQDPSGAAGPTA